MTRFLTPAAASEIYGCCSQDFQQEHLMSDRLMICALSLSTNNLNEQPVINCYEWGLMKLAVMSAGIAGSLHKLIQHILTVNCFFLLKYKKKKAD